MKRSRHTRKQPFAHFLLLCALVLSIGIAGCDFTDPTEVDNPSTTDDDLANAPEPVNALLPGLRKQFASALSAIIVTAEFGSDNFSINGTGLGDNDFDFPRIVSPNTRNINSTADGTAPYWNLQELRALCDFVLDDIGPGDATATNEALAEARYYRGMAYLMQGENFVALPTQPDESPVPAGQLLDRARADFEQARQLGSGSDFALYATAALARTHRALGNASEAAQFANEALAAGGNDFLFLQEFDENSTDNEPHTFLVERSLQEMQPLPRLDFLDPKYIDDEQGIAVAKGEEMMLILAEVDLANGDFAGARQQMTAVVNLAANRPRDSFDDGDPRLDNALNIRPRSAAIMIRDDADSPFRAGLVLERPGVVTTPMISATSVTVDDVNNTADGAALIRLFYLLRQEVLFLEGRRMHDLGIRYPMMLREIDTNPNLNTGDFGTQVIVPDYIPASNEMDLYNPLVLYDADENLIATEVTILHDMNKILAEQRGLVVNNPLLP